MRLALIALIPLVAACSAQPTVPQAVDLSREVVTVDFGSGPACTGARVVGAETDSGWSGQLEGCPQSYAYEVEMLSGTNPVRFVLEEGLKALGGDDLLSPLAVVRVQQPDGPVHEFASPPSRDHD